MPRRSAKQAKAPAGRSSSKRPASPKAGTPIRQSKRAKATPAKSSYFEHNSDEEDIEEASEFGEDAEGGQESAYDDVEAKITPSPSTDSDIEPDESNGKDEKPHKKGQPKKGVLMAIRGVTKDKDLWKPGAKLPPGTQVIIKKPKARGVGDTPYTDETIHPNTMLFLKDLAANNDRAWLKMHDPDYRASLQDFTTFLDFLTQKVIEVDETIPELPVKDIIFRIYRDIRFSSDPTPYKTHFSAAWSRTGRKGPYAAYYVQIKPGGSFVGGGLWCPAAEPLSFLRRDIDRKPHNIKRVLTDAGIRKEFLGGVANDEKKAVTAFCSQSENASNALKTKPKGYENDHKDIQLLRLRNFTIGTKLADDEVVGPKGLDRIVELLSCMVPFITYLNSVVMPDAAQDSDLAASSSAAEEEDDDSAGDEGGE